jgi:hypothetical protein
VAALWRASGHRLRSVAPSHLYTAFYSDKITSQYVFSIGRNNYTGLNQWTISWKFLKDSSPLFGR